MLWGVVVSGGREVGKCQNSPKITIITHGCVYECYHLSLNQ